jgi:tRNA pseudouridine55 synthase
MAATPTETTLFGVLLVDKPTGPTSHDVVQSVRRNLGVRRVGHTGTLDPFASGLLLLCVGPTTRLVDYFHALPKSYEGTLRLGEVTTTDDHTGEVTSASDAWRTVTENTVHSGLRAMIGSQLQRPPTYSAKKVGGRRAHREARAGRAMELAPSPITVHSLELVRFEPPDVLVRVSASTGTYIRALARDLGASLGCGAHLSALRRTAIGPFDVVDAISPENASLAEATGVGGLGVAWREGPAAVPWLPARALDDSEAVLIGTGRRVERGRIIPPAGATPDADPGRVALVHGGRLLAIGREEGDDLLPEKVFHVG